MLESARSDERLLLIGPGAGWSVAPEGLSGAREPDSARARERLLAGDHTAAFVLRDLDRGESGVELIGQLVARGCRTPLILALPAPDEACEEAALRAGAVACVDLSRVDAPRELSRAARFADAARRRHEAERARVLEDLAVYLTHEGKNAVAAIRGAVEVVRDHLPPGAADRELCQEIRARLDAFARELDRLSALMRPGGGAWSPRALAAFLRAQGDPPSGGARVSD